MKTKTLLAALVVFGSLIFSENATAQRQLDLSGEYIIISGGPALRQWEDLRKEQHQHDRWWGNFIRTARIRVQQLQKQTDNKITITWFVYKKGYAKRADEDGTPLIENIESVRDKYKINLVWFDQGSEIINYVNNAKHRSRAKVTGFEFFGHSNKYCFVFDYSNDILGASSSYLHQSALKKFNRKAFSKKAYCKSWGCHSAESFCAAFKRATGIKMIGAIGKTDYSPLENMKLPVVSPGGRWVN